MDHDAKNIETAKLDNNGVTYPKLIGAVIAGKVLAVGTLAVAGYAIKKIEERKAKKNQNES